MIDFLGVLIITAIAVLAISAVSVFVLYRLIANLLRLNHVELFISLIKIDIHSTSFWPEYRNLYNFICRKKHFTTRNKTLIALSQVYLVCVWFLYLSGVIVFFGLPFVLGYLITH